eukprot:Gb_01180 [translate_table: standard]
MQICSSFEVKNMENGVGSIAHPQHWEVAVVVVMGFIICYLTIFPKAAMRLWTVLGAVPTLFFHANNIYDWLTDIIIKEGGSVRFMGPWNIQLVTAHPKNIEYVFNTRFDNFPKGDYLRNIYRDFLGDYSMLIVYGDSWRELKKMVSFVFGSSSFRKNVFNTLPKLVQERLFPVLENACEKGCHIDLQEVFVRYTLDSIFVVGFGADLMSLAVGLPEVPFLTAFENADRACIRRLLKPTLVWKMLRYFGIGMEGELRGARRTIDECIAEIIANARRKCNHADDYYETDRPLDMLSILLQRARGGRSMVYNDDEYIRDCCVSIILAALDTTATALTWFFWLLQLHPDVERKIVVELQDILKQRVTSCPDDPLPFAMEELKEMHYLQAALNECLRLYPPVPVQISEVAEDDVLPDGTCVKKGWNVLYPYYSMARIESLWGKDCREFKPERWLKNGKLVRESEFKFPAFNGGPRRCTGKEYAYWQMKWVAASIIVCYRVKLVEGHPVLARFGLTLYMKHGLLVNLHPRSTP